MNPAITNFLRAEATSAYLQAHTATRAMGRFDNAAAYHAAFVAAGGDAALANEAVADARAILAVAS